MASLEKLMKSWETLRHLPSQITDEVSSRRKEKMSLCVTTADTFCSTPGLKTGGVNVVLLNFAMESLIQMCNDSDSDVRMTADESLNRIIRKAVMNGNVMKVQVELHKEIKRNGNARSLRAALWRFAHLSHMIRPQKGKAYVNNLLPCLIEISKRSEESVQETLASSVSQIFKSLGLFTADKDVKELLKAFLQNLSSDSAQVRRTAASCIVSICQHCRKPSIFFMETLNTLVDSLIPIREIQAVSKMLGVLGCLRALIPQFSSHIEAQTGQGELRGSFGVKRGHNKGAHSTAYMMQVYELSIHFSKHADHNVVNAALELLHQLLVSPPAGLIPLLLSPHGISKSKIASAPPSPILRRSFFQSSASVPTPTSEEVSLFDLDSDLPTAMSAAVSVPLIERWACDNLNSPAESLKSKDITTNKISPARLQLLDAADPTEPDLPSVPEHKSLETTVADLQFTDSSPDDSGEHYMFECLQQDTQLREQDTPPPSASGFSVASTSPGDNETETKFQACDIGSLGDGSIPLAFCARHLATSFLLTGYPGCIMPDQNVRVSVKALALNCVAAIVRLHPNVFQLYLDKEPISPPFSTSTYSIGSSSSQPLCDLMLFGKHSDPQLRAICCTLLTSLIRSVLVQSGGNWQSWQGKADSKVSACLALPRLIHFLILGLEDESSTTCRLTLVSLTQCLSELLKSQDSRDTLPILSSLINLAQNPYWLVKVKLLELVSDLPFVIVSYVTGSSSFQEQVIYEVLLNLLSDEDSRVRRSASMAITRAIPNLYYAVDHHNVNEVYAVARKMSESQLSQILVDTGSPTSTMTGKHKIKISLLNNLAPPFNVWNSSGEKYQGSASVEASLSRIVYLLSQLLLESSSKHLTLGCCEALTLLSERYPPATHVNGWHCLICPNFFQPVNKSGTKIGENGASSNFSAASGLLHSILSLLLTSSITLELGAQRWLNSLAGNLFCGLAVSNMHCVEGTPLGVKKDSSQQLWSMFKDTQISVAAESLLLHAMRTLCIISHVLEDSHPAAASNKPGLPSLSPVKRHGNNTGKATSVQGDSPQENKSGRGISPVKNTIHAGEKEEKSEEKRSGKNYFFGSIVNNQHYLKYHDLLRSAFLNYKTSLETDIFDKFVGLTNSILNVLSQLLEVMTLIEAGRIVEELLLYLRGTMSLCPTATVHCVSQLLKCVVGMNLLSFWSDSFTPNYVKQTPFDSGSVVKDYSLYVSCFQDPFQQLDQFLKAASTAKSLSVDICHSAGPLPNLHLWSNTKGGSKAADTSFLASYIRLFEPMVIESLQQYTVTSDVRLQVNVLLLLTQLVQLRVNYCLLDSEMVFIGFVQKQFEFIEEGQISNAEDLITSIFHFMVLLSFEKHHSKSITTIPKVIQLCDGLMASGQNPLTHCIPALIPVVEHVFVSKSSGSSAVIDADELETQREVMVAMLLRLIEYHEVMRLLSVVLVECRSWPDGEVRWRRWSIQVCDAVLGLLHTRRLRLDSRNAQKALHQLLLHSVSPDVLESVDSLLRILFSPPPHVETSVQSVTRWLGTVLATLLVLVAQGKEDTTLARIEELEIELPAVFFRGDTVHSASADPLNVAAIATSPLSHSSPQLKLARLVLRVIGLVGEKIDCIVMDPSSSTDLLQDCEYLEELLAHFLLVCIRMFQSGNYCKIGSAAVELVAGQATEDSLLLEDANAVFLQLAPACPLLMFLWCYLLTLLSYGNHAFWARMLPSMVKDGSKKDENSQCNQKHSINKALVKTGAAIVYGQFICENPAETEQLLWLLDTQIFQLIELSVEFPVQELFSALHRNPDHSNAVLQAVEKNYIPFDKTTIMVRLLKCLEGIHPLCSGALLFWVAKNFVNHAHPAIGRRAAQLCTRRAEYLLTLPSPQVEEQLSQKQLKDVLHFFHHSHLDRKHSGLVSILNKLGTQCLAMSPLQTEQGRLLSPSSLQNLKLDKDWYLAQVKIRCSLASCTGIAVEESTYLLGHLNLEDAVSVLSSPDIHLSILQMCFRYGTNQTQQAYTAFNFGESVEDNLSPLYRAARIVLMQKVHHFTELVPKDHQVFLPFGRVMTEEEMVYSKNLHQVLSKDLELDSVFCLAAAVSNYLESLEKLYIPIPSEAAEDLVAFAILCLEAVRYLLAQDMEKKVNAKAGKPYCEKKTKSLSVENCDAVFSVSLQKEATSTSVSIDKNVCLPQPHSFELGLECASRVLCQPYLGVHLNQCHHVTWISSACSAVASVVQFATLGELLPSVPNNGLSEAFSNTESVSIAHACHQMSTLVTWLEKHRFNRTSQNIPGFLMVPIHKLIVCLSRTQPLNSYVWTPPEVWRHGWTVKLQGPYQTQVPPLPAEFLQDLDVLRQFIFRVNTLGWTSRHQFEETWMSFLSVLSADSYNGDIGPEDMAVETEANSTVIEAITSLLLQTLLLPEPGNPSSGHFMHCSRDLAIQCPDGSVLAKLNAVQQLLLWKEESIHSRKFYSVFDRPNLERIHSLKRFCFGQVSVEYLQYALARSQGASVQEDHFSLSVITKYEEHCKALKSSGVDVNSCLYFLLDLCTQWTQPQLLGMSGVQSRPLHEVLCSVLAVSDLFTEQSQWQWLLKTSLDLGRTHPVEDDILRQYVVLSQCKACSMLQPEATVQERILRTVESCLLSTFVPTVNAGLHGLLYMLQGCLLALRVKDKNDSRADHSGQSGGQQDSVLTNLPESVRNVVTLTAEYIIEKLPSNSYMSVNEESNLILWALAFFLLDNYSKWRIDTLEQAVPVIVQQALGLAHPNSCSSPTLQRIIMQGFERLIVTESQALTPEVQRQVTKLAVESITDQNPCVLFHSLQLLLSCMYMGHESQVMVHGTNSGSENTTDPEQLFQAMEKTSALFDRIKKGYPQDVELVCSVLPNLLTNFFPASEVLTKVVGEFLSPQQPHPRLLAGVVFQVFECAVAQSQLSLLQEWFVLSLSNFTQTLPVPMATWCLTCFFISASLNPWLRALFPHVQSRIGRCEFEDRRLLCLSAVDFFHHLTSESQTSKFVSTFQAAVNKHPNSPFEELLASLLL